MLHSRPFAHVSADLTQYHDFGADYYEQQHRDRVLRSLNRQAARLGFRLEPATLAISPGVS